eukprot:3725760-Rhodomonas_salina.1
MQHLGAPQRAAFEVLIGRYLPATAAPFRAGVSLGRAPSVPVVARVLLRAGPRAEGIFFQRDRT